MAYVPRVADSLLIDGVTYSFVEQAGAPGSGRPHAQAGRASTVYRMVGSGRAAALKVFEAAYRSPSLVRLSSLMAPLAYLPGLSLCKRTVLTPERHSGLLRAYPDLAYSVLMPWVSGPTWLEVVRKHQPISAQQSLDLAASLAACLAAMEQRGAAHCDLSGGNLMLAGLAQGPGNEALALMDLEHLYLPGVESPQQPPDGSLGYIHRSARSGLWNEVADRFAGAVLVSEMLGWCEEDVVAAASADSYFQDGQTADGQDGAKYEILHGMIGKRWGEGLASLLEKTWHSRDMWGCPSLSDWEWQLSLAAASGLDAAPIATSYQIDRDEEEGAKPLDDRAVLSSPWGAPLVPSEEAGTTPSVMPEVSLPDVPSAPPASMIPVYPDGAATSPRPGPSSQPLKSRDLQSVEEEDLPAVQDDSSTDEQALASEASLVPHRQGLPDLENYPVIGLVIGAMEGRISPSNVYSAMSDVPLDKTFERPSDIAEGEYCEPAEEQPEAPISSVVEEASAAAYGKRSWTFYLRSILFWLLYLAGLGFGVWVFTTPMGVAHPDGSSLSRAHATAVVATAEARAMATPIPVLPTATSRSEAGLSRMFGPVGGKLDHPGAGSVAKWDFKPVSTTEFLAEARFTNPYDVNEHGWDYGFVLAFTEAGEYLQIVVDSSEKWQLRAVSRDMGKYTARLLSSGRVSNLNLTAGGANLLRVLSTGSMGVLYCNESRVATFDLHLKGPRGQIGVSTGMLDGNSVAGKSTAYSQFKGWALPGPDSTPPLASWPLYRIAHDPTSTGRVFSTGIYHDFVAEASFTNPHAASEGPWDHGFFFRITDAHYRLTVDSKARWKLVWVRPASNPDIPPIFEDLQSGTVKNLERDGEGTNRLRLVCLGDSGLFFVNGRYVDGLDLSRGSGGGRIAAASATGVESPVKGEYTDVKGFYVWPLDP